MLDELVMAHSAYGELDRILWFGIRILAGLNNLMDGIARRRLQAERQLWNRRQQA